MRRLVRYIHRNPVEAGISTNPALYDCSSHNTYFGRATFTWLEMDRVLSYFGVCRATSLVRLTEFMGDAKEAAHDIDEIEKAHRLGIYGDEESVRPLANVSHKPELGTGYSNQSVCLDRLISEVGARFGVTQDQMQSESKSKACVDARSVLAGLGQRLRGMTCGEVGHALAKHSGTISRLARRAEKTPRLRGIVEEVVDSFA